MLRSVYCSRTLEVALPPIVGAPYTTRENLVTDPAVFVSTDRRFPQVPAFAALTRRVFRGVAARSVNVT